MIRDDSKYSDVYNKELAKIEKLLVRVVKGKKPKSLYEPCEYILNGGGKRIRPILVLFCVKAGGGQFTQAYNAAVAVEILHNFTLVHDDIMDNSDKRRGRETLHRKYDTSTAILSGDNLIALAYESLLKDTSSGRPGIISSFTKGIIEVCEGQSLDKEFELRDDVNLQEYKVMIYKKTAALLQTCCSIGMQIANASSAEVEAVESYGKNLGMAFQIQDDLLDIVGQEDQFGKRIGSDLIEGKKTFLFLSAIKKAQDQDLLLLQKVINNKGVSPKLVDQYQSLYIKLGILDEARKEIKRYTKLALQSLEPLKNEEGKALLNWLANSLIDRTK